MKINLKATNMMLTKSVRDYVEKRVTNLSKLLTGIEKKGGKVRVNFEVAKSTNHHKSGDIFHADCLINVDGEEFYSSADEEDLNAAVDEVKDTLYREISKFKDRRRTLHDRGARSVKKMMKGLSRRNPLTSKY